MSTPPNDWMTSAQLCEWLQITPDWLYDRVNKREIPHIKIGRLLRFNRQEMEKYTEDHRVNTK